MNSASESACPAEIGSICARRHWSIYWLLIALAFAAVVSNILHVRNAATRGESPFFSANDRSRWCTIYSLVHDGTYVIDERVTRPAEIHWDTIDKVQHVGRDGFMHQYSSKPTLLPTLLAGEYWILNKTTGLNLDDDPIWVARIMLIFSNAIPFALMLVFLASVLERLPVSDWVRYFIVACAGFGTFLTPFCITLNNHLPAAVAVMATLCCVDSILRDEQRRSIQLFFVAGLAAGFAFANELPALAFVAAIGLVLLVRAPVLTLLGYVPGTLIVILALVGTNWLAHDEWSLPYSHRTDGAVIARWTENFEAELDSGAIPLEIATVVQGWCADHSQNPLELPRVEVGTWMGQAEGTMRRWVVRDAVATSQFAITKLADGKFSLREWNNWYDFPGSYWSASKTKRSQVDNGEHSQLVYTFHILIGHHGIVSLTPIWLLGFAGLFALPFDWRYRLRWLGWVALAMTVIVIAFYVTRQAHDRNYGGMTSGLRWAFWLIPLWLVAMAPVVQSFARYRWSRTLAIFLLVASVLSVNYANLNPWVQPWLYEVWTALGQFE